MNKEVGVIFAALTMSSFGFAASESMVWGNINASLPQFMHKKSILKPGTVKQILSLDRHYQLKLLEITHQKIPHSRYQIFYKGIPVWGHQLVFHSKAGIQDTVTGMNVTGIESDLSDLKGKLSANEIEKKWLSTVTEPVKYKTIDKVIYIDPHQKAHLAYHLGYYTNPKSKEIKAPNYIIDANNGELLKQWNNAHYEKMGQGLGGNAFPLPYRAGMYQHGEALPGLPSLGKFEVKLKENRCWVESPSVKVLNLENVALGYGPFPISVMDEATHQLKAFSYPCDEMSLYLNYADDQTGPVNYSFSPVNDTMYFAEETLGMYQSLYGVENPIGDDLPIRAYTHLGAMDNAFAIPTIRHQGRLLAHQQIVIGNGDMFLTAPAQAVIGHELSHNFTELNSGLLYDGQSGGINESFSDMAAIALQDYLRRDYPWYWDGEDWTIGREAVLGDGPLGGSPLRYMDEPSKDGLSIDNAADYTEELDVHHSSGVFNKAFYLLAHKTGWSIQQAFQVMIDANMHYWSPIAYYDFAACGVIQAAMDRELNTAPVIEAFSEVGVVCPIHKG